MVRPLAKGSMNCGNMLDPTASGATRVTTGRTELLCRAANAIFVQVVVDMLARHPEATRGFGHVV